MTAHINLGDIYTKMATEAYNKALEIDKSNNLIAYVDNIKFDPKHSIKDPEEQLCAHYGINFKEVNNVELCHDSYDDV